MQIATSPLVHFTKNHRIYTHTQAIRSPFVSFVPRTLSNRRVRPGDVKHTFCYRCSYAMYATHTLWVHRARVVRKEGVRIACALRIQRKHNGRGASALRVQRIRMRTSRSFVHAQNFWTRSAYACIRLRTYNVWGTSEGRMHNKLCECDAYTSALSTLCTRTSIRSSVTGA